MFLQLKYEEPEFGGLTVCVYACHQFLRHSYKNVIDFQNQKSATSSLHVTGD
jgi:hypothetical protein